ncbi:MAG: hypothetical protein HQL53_02075 [Magnetococcales bacterium]|nr:hypothetical protein [Magnetococcales bacterium]
MSRSRLNAAIHKLMFIALLGATLFGLFIFVGQTLICEGTLEACCCYDMNDDRNHTFVNLHSAREIIRVGEVPQINFYNNFGTPILGDNLTFPFSITSIPYWFFQGGLAININKTLILAVTLWVFYALFRQLAHAGPMLALALSWMALSNYGFTAHFPHHHYHTGLLFLGLYVLAYLRIRNRPERPVANGLIFFSVAVLGVYSLNINVHSLAIMFFLIFLGICSDPKQRKQELFKVLALYACGAVATFPEWGNFLSEMVGSFRLGVNFAEVGGYKTSFLNIFYNTVGLRYAYGAKWAHHHDAFMVYPPIFFMLAYLGAREARLHGRMALSSVVLLLGVVPYLLVFYMQSYKPLHWAIPFFRGTDATRLLWFATVFLTLGIGVFLFYFKRGLRSHWRWLMIFGLLGMAVELFILNASPLNRRWVIDHLLSTLMSASLVFFGLMEYLRGRQGVASMDEMRLTPLAWFNPFVLFYRDMVRPGIMIAVTFHALAFWLFICGCCKTGDEVPYKATYPRDHLIQRMAPGSRMATQQISSLGHDLLGIYDDILGANGRSILMQKDLFLYLLNAGQVVNDDVLSGYHFSAPWRDDLLARLGIRYLLVKEGRENIPSQTHWKMVDGARIRSDACRDPRYTRASHPACFMTLYESRRRISPFYLTALDDSARRLDLHSYRFVGNTAQIELPELACAEMLTLTFAQRPWWRLSIDGRERAYQVGEDSLLRVEVKPGDRLVTLRYGWVTWWNLGLFLLVGLGLAYGVARVQFGAPGHKPPAHPLGDEHH